MSLNALLRDTVPSECTAGCLAAWKASFAAILLVEGLIFGHIVFLLKRSATSFSIVLQLGNALSAGVFFAAGVLHVLPEAVELFEGSHSAEEAHVRQATLRDDDDGVGTSEEQDDHAKFAWPFFILMISFYILFFIEKILFPYIQRRRGSRKVDVQVEQLPQDVEIGCDPLKIQQQVAEPTEKGFRSREFVSGVIEILGLSAHSLFESMALGLSAEFDTVLNIFIATAAHRWATATAISFKLVRHLSYFPFLVLLLLFSAMVPAGVGIGAALTSLSLQARGVLFSISAGTFIYIGVFETMAEEFVQHKDRVLGKFIFTLMGAGIITVVTVILNVLDIHE